MYRISEGETKLRRRRKGELFGQPLPQKIEQIQKTKLKNPL